MPNTPNPFPDPMGFRNVRKRSYPIRVSPVFKEHVDSLKQYMLTEKHIKISDYDATELIGREYKKYKRNEKIWGF